MKSVWGVVEGRRLDGVYVLEIQLLRPIQPSETEDILREAHNAFKPGPKPLDLLVLSGRMPLWLAAALAHHFGHLVPALAMYDPKLHGAVIVCSHTEKYHIGQVVPMQLAYQPPR